MNRLRWRTWAVQYVLPTVILLGSLAVMLAFSDDPDMVWIFIVAPVLSFLAAFAVVPERAWVTPLATGLLLGLALVAGAVFGPLEPRGSVASAFLYTVPLVAAPLMVTTWLGRGFGEAFRDWREDRRWQQALEQDRRSSTEGPRTSAR